MHQKLFSNLQFEPELSSLFFTTVRNKTKHGLIVRWTHILKDIKENWFLMKWLYMYSDLIFIRLLYPFALTEQKLFKSKLPESKLNFRHCPWSLLQLSEIYCLVRYCGEIKWYLSRTEHNTTADLVLLSFANKELDWKVAEPKQSITKKDIKMKCSVTHTSDRDEAIPVLKDITLSMFVNTQFYNFIFNINIKYLQIFLLDFQD